MSVHHTVTVDAEEDQATPRSLRNRVRRIVPGWRDAYRLRNAIRVAGVKTSITSVDRMEYHERVHWNIELALGVGPWVQQHIVTLPDEPGRGSAVFEVFAAKLVEDYRRERSKRWSP